MVFAFVFSSYFCLTIQVCCDTNTIQKTLYYGLYQRTIQILFLVMLVKFVMPSERELETILGISVLQNSFSSSLLNLDHTIQYSIPLILLFRYCVKFIKARNRGLLKTVYHLYKALSTAVGAVRSRNVTETVTTIAVPLVADLLKARLVDSVELLWLHLAVMNSSTIAKLVRNIRTKGPNE